MNYWDILLAEKLKKDPPLPPIPDNAYLLEQATGDVITLTDAAALPMPTATTTLTPIQDLHGYSNPWVGGAGVNLMPAGEAKTYTENGITFTSDGKGRYTVKGTATADASCYFSCDTYTTPNGANTTIAFYNTQDAAAQFMFYNGETQVDAWGLNKVNRAYYGFTQLSQKQVTQYKINVNNGAVIDMTLSPMFINGDVTSNLPPFSPYSNICPISGYDSAEYTRTGVNLFDKAKATDGYKASDDGNFYQQANQSISDYIKVNGNTSYYAQNVIGSNLYYSVVEYDKNKNIIGYKGVAGSGLAESGVITTSANTRYVILNYTTTNADTVALNYPSTITTYQPYQGQNVTLTFEDTIYSGVIDWCTGVVTVDKAMVDLGDLSWTYYPSVTQFYSSKINNAYDVDEFNVNLVSDSYPIDSRAYSEYTTPHIRGLYGTRLYIINDKYDDAQVLRTTLTGSKLIYPLATPTTIQLTATQLTTLAGYNTIYTDVGNISLEYWRKEVRE